MRPSTLSAIICFIGLLAVASLWVLRPPVPTESSVAGAAIGGPFTLIDHNGRAVTEKSWPGKYLLVYFGFTHCPDVCPLGLTTIAEALNGLPEATVKKIQPLFITVDPERDTAKSLHAYIPLFHEKLLGLTGSVAEIEKVKKDWRVYAEKQGSGADYMVNHSAFTYLMAPDGTLAHIFAHDTKPEEMQKVLEDLVRSR